LAISQNLLFSGECPEDEEYKHPKGMFIAKFLKEELEKSDWDISPIDNWRDAGWFIGCTRIATIAEVVFSDLENGQWLLQIAPSHIPRLGLFARLMGKKLTESPSASDQDCFEIAKLVHLILLDRGFTSLKWCWDGYPDETNSTEEPKAANGS
jgi:hypothetical protein